MRLEIVVFLVILGAFLFWKFGKGSLPKFTLPKIDVSGIGNNKWWANKDEDDKRLFLYIIIIIVAYFAGPALWIKGAVALVGVHLVWFFYPKKGSWFTKAAIYGILVYFVLAWLLPDVVKIRDASIIVTKKLASDASNGAISFAKNYEEGISEVKSITRQVETEPASVIHRQQTRTVNIIATQGAFTEVKIPPATDFRWDVQEGCLIAVTHDGDPYGSIYDCAEHIEFGTYLRNLRIGFSSKTEAPVKIAVKLTPL